MNIVMLIGRLTRDPELRYIPTSGTPVATFSLAVDRELSKEKRQEAEESGKPTADFINIVVWGKQAENCANYLEKGRQVAVAGRLQSRSYEARDGGKRYLTEVVAARVEFLGRNGKGNNNNSNDDTDDIDIDFPGLEGFEPIDDDNIPF